MNGKGDRPRNNASKQFRSNYDDIDWGKEDEKPTYEQELRAKRMKKHQQVSIKSNIIDE